MSLVFPCNYHLASHIFKCTDLPFLRNTGGNYRPYILCRLHHLGIQRRPKAGITDNPNGISPSRYPAGKAGVIRKHRSKPNHNPHILMPASLNPLTGSLPGNPFGSPCYRGDFPVGSHGIFHYHIGRLIIHIVEKHLIDGSALLFQNPGHHFNSMSLKHLHPFSCNQGVFVHRAHIYLPYSALNNNLRTGRGLSVMTAGLQSHVNFRSPHILPAI